MFPKLNLSLSTWNSRSSYRREMYSGTFHLQSKQTNKNPMTSLVVTYPLLLLYLLFFFFVVAKLLEIIVFTHLPFLLVTLEESHSSLLVTLYPFQSCPWIHYSTELLSSWLPTISMMQNAGTLPLTSLRVQHILLTFPLSFWLLLSVFFVPPLLDFRMLTGSQAQCGVLFSVYFLPN